MKRFKLYLVIILSVIGLFLAVSSFAGEMVGNAKGITEYYVARALTDWEPAAIMLFGAFLVLLAGVCRKRLVHA